MSHFYLGCACCTLPHMRTLTTDLWAATEVSDQLNTAQQSVDETPSWEQAQATIFHNGVIHTLAAEGDQRVEALGVAGGIIIATGTLQTVRQAMQEHHPSEIDLSGRTLLPGFIDPHMHILPSAVFKSWLSLTPFKSAPHQQELDPQYSFQRISEKISEALARPETLPKDKNGTPWVLGFGVDPSLMHPWEDITADQLDALDAKVPILLLNASGHIAYLNGAALKAANIDKNSSGVLTEGDVTQAVAAAPELSIEIILSNAMKVLNDAAALGNTTLFDAGLGNSDPKREIGLFKSFTDQAPVRIGAALFTQPNEASLDQWLSQETPDVKNDDIQDTRFSIKAIKLIADGSNQGLTGFQSVPYACFHEHSVPDVPATGVSNYPKTDLFTQMLEKAVDHGWPVLVHANGDRAVDYVLDGYERVLTPQAGGPNDEQAHKRRQLRLRVEHASLLSDDAIARMAKMQLSPSFLIGHVGYWGYTFQQTILGQERARLLDRCQSALEAGMRISLHSDHFVTPLGPLRMMEQAVYRTMEAAPGKEALNPEERLSRMQALRAVTLDAAWQCHMDHLVGSLEPGKLADLVILAQDPLDDTVSNLRDIVVEETWLAGVTAYRRDATTR